MTIFTSILSARGLAPRSVRAGRLFAGAHQNFKFGNSSIAARRLSCSCGEETPAWAQKMMKEMVTEKDLKLLEAKIRTEIIDMKIDTRGNVLGAVTTLLYSGAVGFLFASFVMRQQDRILDAKFEAQKVEIKAQGRKF
ncbi:MAG: hypothetical protein SGILL_010044 [Bacillariaceae sp.]